MAKSASLFVTCLVDSFYPRVGEAVVTVLERLGYEVDFPERQTCCGLPLYNNGYVDEARKLAAHTVSAMTGEAPIVVPSGSCAWMLRKIYPTLLDSAESRAVAARVTEFSELVAASGASFELPAARAVTYHPSCHLLRGLHQAESPRAVLSSVKQLTVLPLENETECCGFGGTFSVRYDQVSTAMMNDKLGCAGRTGAGELLVSDAGCMLQLDGGARRAGCSFAVRHLAEVVAEADAKGRS
jgi:L-lactate dehydrogenase complex protein LldE